VAFEIVFATWPNVEVGNESNGSVALDVQIALRELESVLVEHANVIHVAVGLIEVMLVARIDQRMHADAKVVVQILLDGRYVRLGLTYMLADGDRLPSAPGWRNDHLRLDLFSLAGMSSVCFL